MVKDNIKEYKETLENRERTYRELSKRGRWMQNFGALLVAFSFVFFILLPVVLPPNTAFILWVLTVIIGIIMVQIGVFFVKSKGVPKVYFSPDEQIFLKIFDGLTFLDSYVKEKLEPARYQCLKELREAYKLIEYHWELSEIGVVMKEIGDEIETFKEKFDRNLIFTLESSEKIETLYDKLTKFAEYLIAPSKEKLIALNNEMDSLLHSKKVRAHYTTTDFLKITIFDFLKHYQVHRHALVIALIFTVTFSPTLFLIYYCHASIDTAALVFAAIFGPIVTIYLTHTLKKYRD